METKEKFNIYRDITSRIVAKLRSGVIPWQRVFTPGVGRTAAVNYVTRHPYSLLNQMLLGDNTGEYLTFKQALGIKGAHVREGAKSRRVCFFSMVEKKKPDLTETPDEDTRKETYPCLRYYNVFSIDDVEGVASKYATAHDTPSLPEADAVADAFLRRSGVKVRHADETPSYDPATDTVTIPTKGAYKDAGDYYAELFRLLVTATGTPGRLDRGVDAETPMGPDAGAREELTCEMGAALLLAQCGMDPEAFLDHSAAYVDRWVSFLEEDCRAVVTAASRAEKAIAFITRDEEGKAMEAA